MASVNDFINTINGILFSDYTVYALLITGLLFTIWSGFGQFRAITHGVSVVRGKYDDKNDPGAINHFQALSAALSATVGLGNIAGVAVAVALGGPGAIFWMWIIGILGMALKMTEVTQSMLYRNTNDPENPHGGPMFVVKKGFAEWGLAPIGAIIGGIFVVTLIISAITGGNMFQAWNVADITFTYFGVPQVVTGIILTVLVGTVIIGGIKRIGAVAGRIVPFMCIIYVLAAGYVLLVNAGQIPSMLALIVKSGLPPFLGGESANPEGAFLGGTFAYAAMWGVKRALFSSEAGQGSSPIAHSAAKTDEPVREGIVAGLEPFIDTIVVCTLTALVILSSGAYNRDAESTLADATSVQIVQATDDAGELIADTWTLTTPPLPAMTGEAKKIRRAGEGTAGWREGETIFVVLAADENTDTGRDLRKMTASVSKNDDDQWIASWGTLESVMKPHFRENEDGSFDLGLYGDYAGASMTAYAFDRVTPGLGKWLVSIAAWLFALSTMISWSYYGEQGVYYFFGSMGERTANAAILLYKLIYCLLILVTTLLAMSWGGKPAMIGTDTELDMWTTLGLGVMLVANIPIMLLFGAKSMKAYHGYIGRLKRGELHPHAAPSVTDVVEGKDVE
ncbi:MAG: sodium:alanine symporter family protein [Planctomycetota bacterium]|nr:MAG: sodium:alanine symporter family protein [Planctomycetota bacterium]